MNLYKRDNSPYWWAQFSVAGKQHRASTGLTDKAAATLKLADMVREAELATVGVVQPKPSDTAPKTFRLAWESWVRFMDNLGKSCTANGATSMTGEFPFADKHTDSVTLDDISGYVAEIRGRNKPGTVKKKVSYLRTFYKFASFQWRTRNLGAELPKVAGHPTRERGILTTEQAAKLFAHPTRGRIYAFITYGGLRKAEAMAAVAGWISGDTLRIAPDSAKFGKSRVVVYPKGFLSQWSGLDADAKIVDKWVDPKVLRADMRAVGLPESVVELMDVHGLRRTVATWITEGVSREAARQQLGHQDAATTDIYVRPTKASDVVEALAAGVSTCESQ